MAREAGAKAIDSTTGTALLLLQTQAHWDTEAFFEQGRHAPLASAARWHWRWLPVGQCRDPLGFKLVAT